MAVKIFLPFEDFKVHIVHNDFSSLIEKKIIFSTYLCSCRLLLQMPLTKPSLIQNYDFKAEALELAMFI